MNINLTNSVIENIKTEFGIAELGFLRLTQKLKIELSANFADQDFSEYPGYIQNSLELRSNPLKLHPWAKSVIIVAIPFTTLPYQPPFLKSATDPELSGKVAGYAMKMDYHTYGKDILAKFAEKLKSKISCDIRTEISIDTAPVAERALAVMAGIGRIGFNSCLLTAKNGSGCFIGEIFTDAEEVFLPSPLPSQMDLHCSKCCRCIEACPTGALTVDNHFSYQKCRSHLTIEKRGMLTKSEQKLISDWIFGCDLCTTNCPKSDLPPPFEVDLEWLLTIPSSQLKTAIKGTTIEYTGVTGLRRNALIVLANKGTEKTKKLIDQFTKTTGSELLKQCRKG